MGAFYGSIHFHADDRAAVQTILQEVSKKRHCKFWLAPPINGWVSAYPDNHGQDDKALKAIAKQFGGDVIHAIVHDDDVFVYLLYRDGKLVDEFNSEPDYFGKVSDLERERVRGNPDVFHSLLQSELERKELATILTSEELLAGDLLGRFAGLLKIPNALSSYEYLLGGETDGIQRWAEFIHVPDRSKEQLEALAAKARMAHEIEELKEQGVLLMDSRKEFKGNAVQMRALCCTDDKDGFFQCWAVLGPNSESAIERCHFPWTDGSSPTGLVLPGSVCEMRISPSGRFLAVGHAYGNWLAQLWNIETHELMFEVRHTRAADWIGFSLDETRLLSVSDRELVVTSIATGQKVNALTIPGGARSGAVHPSGSHAVIGLQEKLVIIDLFSSRVLQTLCCGGRLDLSERHQQMAKRMNREITEADPKELEKAVRKAAKKFGSLLGKDVDEMVKEQMEKLHEMARQMGATDPERDTRGTENVRRLNFSSDGQQVFCATDHGVRVYDWQQVLTATDETPRPVLSAEAEPVFQEGATHKSRFTYAMAYDKDGKKLLFGGLEGKISCLDLATGNATVLMEPPSRDVIQELHISADRKAVCAVVSTSDTNGMLKSSGFQVWNYPRLLELVT